MALICIYFELMNKVCLEIHFPDADNNSGSVTHKQQREEKKHPLCKRTGKRSREECVRY